MKPLKDYLIRNFEKSTLEQIADDYREKGYTIKLGNKVGPYRVDLTATKGNETVYIELKTHSEKTEAKRRIKDMVDYFKEYTPNAKFIVAISRIPEFKKIEFDDIELVLYEFFMIDLPSDLDVLSTHTRIDEVHGVDIIGISIQSGNLHVICNGMVNVTLQYGSDADMEYGDGPMSMSFPFKFKGTICYDGKNYRVEDCDELEIDTDAYYM